MAIMRYTFHPSIAAAIGSRITAKRVAIGVSGRALALAAHMSDSTICRIEHGDHGPSVESLILIARALGCDPGELLPTLEEANKLLGLEAA